MSSNPTSKPAAALPNVVRMVFTALGALVFILAFHRRYWTDSHDPFKCSILLNEGRWLDALESKPWRRPWQIWQPPGCLLREYHAEDVGHCAGTRQMLFAGDSTVRQVFWSVAKKVDLEGATEYSRIAAKHGDIQFTHRDIDLRFIWDPFLNGTILANELEIYQDNAASTGSIDKLMKEDPAVMIVIGGGLWYARQFEAGAVRQFKETLDKIITFTQRPDGSAWKSTAPFSAGFEGIGNQVFFLPVEEPIYDRLSPARKLTILPEEIDQMNDYLHTLTPSHGLNIPWVYPVMTSKRKWAYEESGLHVIESIVNRRADILLNMRCNAKLDNVIGAPYERTCCSRYTSGNWFQWFLVLCAIAILPLATVWSVNHTNMDIRSLSSVIVSLASIAIVLAYCFFADRTQLFSKAHKLYDHSEFLSLCFIALLFGLVTIRKSKDSQVLTRKNSNDLFTQPTTASFLNRDQTEEWKGWMQVIVLIDLWTGASKELWIYIIVRLIVASYLFMTGYGHAMYFHSTGDYSIRRVAAVLIRLNLLAVALSYQMYTNYLFYYCAPLASFWFLVAYATFRFGMELNGNMGFLGGKIALSASVTALAHSQSQPVDFFFMIVRHIFGINWDANEWRFRVALDGFIVYVGVVVALLHIWIRSVRSTPKCHHADTLSYWLHTLFSLLRLAAITVSLIIPPIFHVLTRRSPDKYDYNWWQPLISPLPILSYMFLRNATSTLRSYHSAGFAWLGRCSLEMWILQFHILTAADGRGVLSLGNWSGGDGTVVGDRWRDLIVLVPLFVGGSWFVSEATRRITGWFVEERDGERLPVKWSKRKTGWERAGDYISVKVAGDVGVRFGVLMGVLWVLNLATG
ncbi:Cas1p-domain-containing protein [Tothia fuscella]|uniref:Cas1p-domain-containing protein n=1 Tax=Tothia fuscella TaxID=1048955 RepID=A0A9P4NSP9_9PEZI|nr:Cas1p-domain-containing protein [Tothia fuscella]